ncbi:fibronectin type III domain-containing protein [Aquimarina sp. RZ0]|uniref:fibronectin type III domain-containing protein n=1 Tax=Aquimarina sp. RZ0 TaxID=2607730 RepID=UPI0011F3DDCC|nr:fibronectin type III domain-containing protein [Aquimarina sp. RZ0]KAA1246693.1 fibronectin type III domain-containing protein [Aquimarina sp. RZ0]
MIKKISFLLIIVSLLISCETEEFNTNDLTSGGTVTDTNNPTEEEVDNCVIPFALSVSKITDKSVIFAWSSEISQTTNYSWEVRYTEKSNALDENNQTTNTLNAQQSAITINNLKRSTVYTVAVRTKCGLNTYSDWSVVKEIKTLQRN